MPNDPEEELKRPSPGERHIDDPPRPGDPDLARRERTPEHEEKPEPR
jgi:hypothetical protein